VHVLFSYRGNKQTDKQTNAGDTIIPRESFRGDNKEFAAVDLDVEALWNLLKDKIESGVKCCICIPLNTRFQNTKWKRPLNDEIRDQIKLEKSLWRQYVRDKNPTSWLKYTK